MAVSEFDAIWSKYTGEEISSKSKSNKEPKRTKLSESDNELIRISERKIEEIQKKKSGTVYEWSESTVNEFRRIPIQTLIKDPYFQGLEDSIFEGVEEDIVDLFEQRRKKQINQAVFLEGIGCLNPSKSWILIEEEGLVLLQDLIKNSRIATLQGTEEVIGRKKEKQKVYYVRTRTGLEIECGYNHLFHSISKDGTIDYKRFHSLNTGDHLSIKMNSNVFGKIDLDEDIAWLLGMLIGDGCITNHISISSEFKDILNLQKIQRILKVHFNCDSFIEKSKRESSPNTYHLTTTSIKEIRRFLKTEGIFGKHSHNKTVPKSVLNGSFNTWKHFLRGYFDSDGSNKKGNIRISSKSKELLNQIRYFLFNIGIISIIKDKKTKVNGKEGVTNLLAINGYYADLFLDKIGFSLERKNIRHSSKDYNTNIDLFPYIQERLYTIWKASGKTQKGFKTVINKNYDQSISRFKLEKFIEEYDKDLRLLESRELKELLLQSVFFDEVVEIKELEEEIELIDLAVSDHNNYIANSIVNHNSGKTLKSSVIQWLLWFELTLYGDPQDYFDLTPGSTIALINLNRTESQARKVTFTEVAKRFDCPFNKDYFPVNPRITTELRISRNNTVIFPGTSSALSALGYNLFGGAIDEACFVKNLILDIKIIGINPVLVYEKAEELRVGEELYFDSEVLIESYNLETKVKEFKPFKSLMCIGYKDVYDIELEDGTILTLTGNQLVLTQANEYKRVDSLSEEDEILEII